MCILRGDRTTMTGFFEADDDELTFIPFDIETTGFKAAEDDFVTTIVLYHDDMYHIWLNTNGETVDADTVQSEIIEGSELGNVILYVCETEKKTLQNVKDYLDTHTDDNTILTAFNGETFRGNTDFDVPFLRTRCFRNGVEWMFDGYWYADIYEVFSQSSRFDTTMKAEPSLDDMKKSDLQQFVDDMGYEVHYDKMLKDEIIRKINDHSSVTVKTLQNWADNNGIEVNLEGNTKIPKGAFAKSELQAFIDDMSVDIPYQKLSKDDIVQSIREREYDEDMLIEWHKQTGRSIGTTEATTLDTIHEAIIEDKMNNESWVESLPFDLEVFSPFDPFVSSGEAVTAYMNGDYSGVILHCFADVARTVNLNRVMEEYAPQKDYKPKVL